MKIDVRLQNKVKVIHSVHNQYELSVRSNGAIQVYLTVKSEKRKFICEVRNYFRQFTAL